MKSDIFPKNVLLLATHGSYFVPDIVKNKLSDYFLVNEERLLKNFSDFATEYLIGEEIPSKQKIIANFSRSIGDPNRDRNAFDIFMDNDFGGIKVWKESLTNDEKEYLLRNYYDVYHKNISEYIELIEEKNKKTFIFDIHDTGNTKMSEKIENDTKKEEKFPEICISNVFGESCSEDVFLDFVSLLEKNLGYKPTLNTPYSGGFVTKKYGAYYNNSLEAGKRFNRNVIQIEFGRYLYMDETTQRVDFEKIKKVREGLEKSIIELTLTYK